MNLTNILLLIRKLAKLDKYQLLFGRGKELHLQLFVNSNNLTELQIYLIKFLSFYETLYLDIALGDIDERVLENNIYEDAYMFYKNQQKDKEKKDLLPSKDKESRNVSQWIFNKPKVK